MMTSNNSEQVVRAWLDAVNAGNVEEAGTLVTDDVAIVGPRGTTSGREVVADWIVHTGIRMEMVSVGTDGNRVTVDAEGTWRTGEGGPDERTSPATITMAFEVEDGRIASIQRL